MNLGTSRYKIEILLQNKLELSYYHQSFLKRSNNENIIINGGPFAGRVTLKDTTYRRVDGDSKSYCPETIALLPTLKARQMVRLHPVVIKKQG